MAIGFGVETGRVRRRPPGLAEVAAAKADGRWAAAYEAQANAGVPPELEQALRANKANGHAPEVSTHR